MCTGTGSDFLAGKSETLQRRNLEIVNFIAFQKSNLKKHVSA